MKVCIQAGHSNVTSGSTGAPGERDWTTKIVPMIAEKLRANGVEVYETDAKGNTDDTVTSTDWDLFLAVHYDADIYNDRGGFVDYPDPSADMVWETSKRLAETLRDHYFSTTGIPERYSRSNANTKFYYMWSALTANTPCVIIECGVGWRKPQDYEVLREYDFIAKTISDGVLKGLGLYDECEIKLAECEEKCENLDQELTLMRESRNKWRDEAGDWQDKYETEVPVLQAKMLDLEDDLAFEMDKNDQLEQELDSCTKEYQVLETKALRVSSELEKCREQLASQIENMTIWEFIKLKFRK